MCSVQNQTSQLTQFDRVAHDLIVWHMIDLISRSHGLTTNPPYASLYKHQDSGIRIGWEFPLQKKIAQLVKCERLIGVPWSNLHTGRITSIIPEGKISLQWTLTYTTLNYPAPMIIGTLIFMCIKWNKELGGLDTAAMWTLAYTALNYPGPQLSGSPDYRDSDIHVQ